MLGKKVAEEPGLLFERMESERHCSNSPHRSPACSNFNASARILITWRRILPLNGPELSGTGADLNVKLRTMNLESRSALFDSMAPRLQ